jgi:hypothetical protein
VVAKLPLVFLLECGILQLWSRSLSRKKSFGNCHSIVNVSELLSTSCLGSKSENKADGEEAEDADAQ